MKKTWRPSRPVHFVDIREASSWYTDQEAAASLLRKAVVRSIEEGSLEGVPDGFKHYSLAEADGKLKSHEWELKLLACFHLISAAEGWLKLDFKMKAEGKGSSPLERQFRKTLKKKGSMAKISVENDVLAAWKRHASSPISSEVGSFKALMNLRHWLAHGRYWQPQLARAIRRYDPRLVDTQIKKLFGKLEALPEGFNWQ